MPRPHRRDLKRMLVLAIDVCLFIVAGLLALTLRENFTVSGERFTAMLPYLAMSSCAAAALFLISGMDRSLWRYLTTQDHVRLLISVFGAVVSAALVTWLTGGFAMLAKSVPVIHAILGVFMLSVARIVWRAAANSGLERLSAARTPETLDPPTDVLVVGLTTQTDLYLRAVERGEAGHVRISGICVDDPAYADRLVGRHLIFSAEERLPDLLRRLAVHGAHIGEIVVALPKSSLRQEILDDLKAVEVGNDIVVRYLAEVRCPSPVEPCAQRSHHNRRGAANCEDHVAFDTTRIAESTRRPFWALKRVVDILGSGFLLVLLSPVIAIVAGIVLWTLGRPLIFWQDRPGYLGRPFRVFKFRTMLGAHDRAGNRLSDEQRQSRIGAFLRKTRLDELPQLWNIFVGEMSFVGPRPLLPVDQHPDYAARLLVRPGLTGWAQVIGGRTISAVDKAALDIWYVRNASFQHEVEICMQTIRMVLKGERVDDAVIAQTWADLEAQGVVIASKANTAEAAPAADEEAATKAGETQAAPPLTMGPGIVIIDAAETAANAQGRRKPASRPVSDAA